MIDNIKILLSGTSSWGDVSAMPPHELEDHDLTKELFEKFAQVYLKTFYSWEYNNYWISCNFSLSPMKQDYLVSHVHEVRNHVWARKLYPI